MLNFKPKAIYYDLGKYLYKKYSKIPWIEIENHNNIPEFRISPNSEFAKMKQNLIVGIRKTHNFVPNHKTSDFLVPYTSSGCSASCLYCYLVCNYNKCSFQYVNNIVVFTLTSTLSLASMIRFLIWSTSFTSSILFIYNSPLIFIFSYTHTLPL